ncbi:hypothetical protein [Roseivivax jejudonensis]|uniref:hypothetical protein n=1 Tax=Roseivivax jejudonensis TaxID=1529041 RepID=UPI00117A8C00|nr:hypothetical protein [Roseivivax jejudonensis]
MVRVTDGLVQYVIDGDVRHDITSVSGFLTAAAQTLDAGVAISSGNVSTNALENYEGGNGPVYDAFGTNPSISSDDGANRVSIGGSGVGGSYRADFDNMADQDAFEGFANDLLGRATASLISTQVGVQFGDFKFKVETSERDDDITQVKFSLTETGNIKNGWADKYVELIAADFGGTLTGNGNVSETNFTANQASRTGTEVNLGSSGVGGKETWDFASEADAIGFLAAVKDAFATNAGSRLDDFIEKFADASGGTQIRDGNVSNSYEARQIKVTGPDKSIVDLGSHKVGGKEQFEFGSQADAQQFIDELRDHLGITAQDGKVVDEFIFKVSGTAGISGSETLVGVDEFVEFAGERWGGTQTRDGSVSENFDGSVQFLSDTEVKLGPRGVGGQERWEFDTAEDAQGFAETLDTIL